jgi:hypothetical protein
MMLHDAKIEATCDNQHCHESEWLDTHWYVGGYNLSDDEAARELRGREWIVTTDGKHYCCTACAETA